MWRSGFSRICGWGAELDFLGFLEYNVFISLVLRNWFRIIRESIPRGLALA